MRYKTRIYLAREAFKVFEKRYALRNTIHSLTVSANSLEHVNIPTQLGIFYDNVAREKRERLSQTIDNIRDIYGKHAIIPAVILDEKKMQRGMREDIIMPGFMYQ